MFVSSGNPIEFIFVFWGLFDKINDFEGGFCLLKLLLELDAGYEMMYKFPIVSLLVQRQFLHNKEVLLPHVLLEFQNANAQHSVFLPKHKR